MRRFTPCLVATVALLAAGPACYQDDTSSPTGGKPVVHWRVDTVRAEGCTEMQGFFFSPPRPIKEIERLFLASSEHAATAA